MSEASTRGRAGYSATRIAIHWLVVILVIVQFLFHEGMQHAWHAVRDGKPIAAGDQWPAYFHAGVGIAILLLALIWIWLRLTRGAPPLPENENAVLKFVARATHVLLYLLIVLIPVSGSTAWFGEVGQAAHVHVLMKQALLYLAILHALGTLFQQFILKSGVLMRMVRPVGG